MLEKDFQRRTISRIRDIYPEAIVIKNDAGYIQGIPDWLILYRDKWAALEFKKSKTAPRRPNQKFYVDKLDAMSFARFIYPENEEEVLYDLQQTFGS